MTVLRDRRHNGPRPEDGTLPPLTAEQRRRYSRQIRLVEIGEAGQAKLCSTRLATLSAGFARTVEHDYLDAAGLHVSPSSSEAPPVDVGALGLRHAATQEIAEGALAALVSIRTLLRIQS